MNKNILAPVFFILLVLALIYNINHSNKKIDDFFILHKKIANIVSTNKNFDIFIANNAKYKNFDYIQQDIQSSKDDFLFIQNNALSEQEVTQAIESMRIDFKEKVDATGIDVFLNDRCVNEKLREEK